MLSKSRPQQTRSRTVSKLLREAECLARVQTCDNVVSLRGIFEDASSAYLVMDHCSGGDLEQLLEVRAPLASAFSRCAAGLFNTASFHFLTAHPPPPPLLQPPPSSLVYTGRLRTRWSIVACCNVPAPVLRSGTDRSRSTRWQRCSGRF